MARRMGWALVLVALMSLLTAGAASAATRYAAPGGNGADPCSDPENPCSLYLAADIGAPGSTIKSGDVVELAPGTYSEAAGELGSFNSVVVQDISLRGEAGKPAPVIQLQNNSSNFGAFQVNEGGTISYLEIENEAEGGVSVFINEGGTMERTIVQASKALGLACYVSSGTVRNSACINEGGGAALGASIGTIPQTMTVVIRNTTAIATGAGSIGVDFNYGATAVGLVANINAKGLIAKGVSKDVVARGKESSGSGKGASTTITLDHSSYATIGTEVSGTGGSASVTPPGTNSNITAAPLLAGDRIHQLPGSPTIGKGAVDAESSAVDIDGEARTGGPAPDIGADELAEGTTSLVRCNPGGISVGGQASCEVVVEDEGDGLTQPSGQVTLSSGSGLSLPSSCALNPATSTTSACSFVVSADAAGTYTVTAGYGGDDLHDGSQGEATVAVAGPAVPPPLLVANPPPTTQLKQHPPKRTTKRKAKFTFASNEAGARFECKLDSKPFVACASPFERKVKLGSHKFRVRAVDSDGKADTTPAGFRWKVLPPS